MSELTRANRISVQVEEGRTLCRFWRTHKLVKEIAQTETGFLANDKLNSTANRELFRAYMVENAGSFGIVYDPADRREDTNKLPSKYTDDNTLLNWASTLIHGDIQGWVSKLAGESKLPLTLVSIEAEEVIPVDTHNGKPVSHKYGNGNWAYATVKVVASVQMGETPTFGYVTMDVSLVSGQLKKPSHIGELGFTYTGFKTELGKDIKEVVAKPESKKEDAETPEPKQEQVQEPVKGSKGKGKGGRKSKKSDNGDTK